MACAMSPTPTSSRLNRNPELANQLLDEIGLTARAGKGFRLAADGSPLQFTIHHQTIEIGSSRGELLELIKECWGDVGIRTELRGDEPSFFWELTDTDQFDVAVRAFEKPIQHLAASTESNWAPLWDQWLDEVYAREAGSGAEGELPREQPPGWIVEHDRRIYQAQQTPEQSEEYRRLSATLPTNPTPAPWRAPRRCGRRPARWPGHRDAPAAHRPRSCRG